MTKTIMTPRKEAIMRMLEADYDEGGRDSLASEFGRPPLTATTVAEYVDWFGGENGRPKCNAKPGENIPHEIAFWHPSASQVQSFARTLRQMADEGLLVRVRTKIQTRNGLAGDVVHMPRTAYYSARTVEDNRLHRVRSYYAEEGEKDGIVIDGCVREVSPADDTCTRAVLSAPTVGPDGEWQLF